MTSTQLVPLIVVPVVAWRIYARIRRNIGRQHLRRGRLITGLTFFSIVTAMLGAAAFQFVPSLEALGGGLVLGGLLAFVSLRLTRFEASSEGEFYTPHTGIGLSVALLLVVRIIYRMTVLFSGRVEDLGAPRLFQSPLTMFIYGVTAGYYITYYSGLLIRSRKSPAVGSGS